MYLSVKAKFVLALIAAFFWFTLSYFLAHYWIHQLSDYLGPVTAFFVIFFIALLPGFMNMFFIMSYLLDERPELKEITTWPNVSIMIAALNEENHIVSAVESLLKQDYPGKLEIIVIDNNSSDKTVANLKTLVNDNVILLSEKQRGKSFALNTGLARASYDYIVTLDADTILLPYSIKKLMERLLSEPPNTAAIAGCVCVKNRDATFLSKLQTWDYLLAIIPIKLIQSLFQGTLVAQGAYSLYRRECLLKVGQWSHTVGEDIVLTWGLLEQGYRIGFEGKAIAFTAVPTSYAKFFRQRSRWARGVLEAFILHPRVLIRPRLTLLLVYWNLFFPIIDICYLFIFVPGILLSFFGNYCIVGPVTLTLIPLAVFVNSIFYFGQKKTLAENAIEIGPVNFDLFIYMLFYYLIMVPAPVYGYLQEIFMASKKWGTK